MIEELVNNDAFVCSLSFCLESNRGGEKANGNGRARLEKEKLFLSAEYGETFTFPLRDIRDIRKQDYRLRLDLSSDESLGLYKLGYKFEDFTRILCKFRNELIIQDMLIREKTRKNDVEGKFVFLNADGKEEFSGKCEVRIYETSLTVIPETSQIFRIPLGHIREFQPEDYSMTVVTDSGERIILSHMGYRLDESKNALDDALNEISGKTIAFLHEMLPGTDAPLIRKVSHLLKEGKLAGRKEIEAVSPDLWEAFEKMISLSPLADEYEFLGSIGRSDRVAVGFKRGLMGGPLQDYFWFLLPIYSDKAGAMGNAAAFEAGTIRLPASKSGDDEIIGAHESDANKEDSSAEPLLKQEGKATYFFRLMGREEYAALKDRSLLDHRLDEIIYSLNRCMQEVNFRREPIYLSEKKLNEPGFIKYKYAINRLPELRRLRDLFIGRVAHRTQGQWRQDVSALLEFNGRSVDNAEKWKKGD
jgi:hypothetical protein